MTNNMTNSKINNKIKKQDQLEERSASSDVKGQRTPKQLPDNNRIITNILSESDKVEVTCVHCDKFQV